MRARRSAWLDMAGRGAHGKGIFMQYLCVVVARVIPSSRPPDRLSRVTMDGIRGGDRTVCSPVLAAVDWQQTRLGPKKVENKAPSLSSLCHGFALPIPRPVAGFRRPQGSRRPGRSPRSLGRYSISSPHITSPTLFFVLASIASFLTLSLVSLHKVQRVPPRWSTSRKHLLEAVVSRISRTHPYPAPAPHPSRRTPSPLSPHPRLRKG
jgi:hypothetical protein